MQRNLHGTANICCKVDATAREKQAISRVLMGIPHRTRGKVPAAVVTLGHGATASEDDLHPRVRGVPPHGVQGAGGCRVLVRSPATQRPWQNTQRRPEKAHFAAHSPI
jgi:hypothetical protein